MACVVVPFVIKIAWNVFSYRKKKWCNVVILLLLGILISLPCLRIRHSHLWGRLDLDCEEMDGLYSTKQPSSNIHWIQKPFDWIKIHSLCPVSHLPCHCCLAGKIRTTRSPTCQCLCQTRTEQTCTSWWCSTLTWETELHPRRAHSDRAKCIHLCSPAETWS